MTTTTTSTPTTTTTSISTTFSDPMTTSAPTASSDTTVISDSTATSITIVTTPAPTTTSIQTTTPAVTTTTPITQATICSDSQSQTITCASGVISLTNVMFGRQSTQVCCYGATVTKYGAGVCTKSTTCSLDVTSRYTSACNSQTNCTLSVPTDVDPCSGVYKYLNAAWNCVPSGKHFFLFQYLY